MSLKRKAIQGVLWTLGQQAGVQSINFIVQIVLARLLMPEAFGLIAMLHVLMAIGTALMDSGMTSSLIRTKDADQSDYSTVFFINLLSSITIYVTLFFSAPFVASFFNQPLLSQVIKVYTLSFVIQALVGVQAAKLTKEMNFKLQMYMQIPATICGGGVGVLLAYKGYGVWSLVWMHLITTFVYMVQHWFRTKWRPSFVFHMSKLKQHLGFGYKLTFSALLSAFYQNSYTLLIGKLFSVDQLGYYNQANTLRQFPIRNLNVALQKVTYPLFATIQDDNDQFKGVFKKITLIVFFIVSPVMLWLVGIAEPLFRYILTEKWLPAVPLFQILCVGAIFSPQSVYNLNIIIAKGRSGLHFRLELFNKLFSSVFLLLIIPYGIWGVVYAQAIGVFIHFFFNAVYSGRLIGYSLREQLLNIIPTLLVSVGSLLLLLLFDGLLDFYLSDRDLLRIVILSLIYFGFYFLTCILFRFEPIFYIKNIISNIIKRK